VTRAPRLRGAAARLAAALAALLAPLAAPAQEPREEGLAGLVAEEETQGPVSLVADRVDYDSEAGTLTASGNVEVYYGDRVLTAARISYDRWADRISARGPLTLTGPEGATLFADAAELDARLRDGLIEGARAVMQGDAKFAAAQARRLQGRYNVLSRAVFSPCRVCEADPVPLWRIRAKRIVHDEEARVIHYENAVFDVLGVPVLWTPYFRHPDPTLERASGFLPPEYSQSPTVGHVVKPPYYWVIDHRSDLTLAPVVTSDDGLLAEGQYRRRFARGALRLDGSVTLQDYDGREELRGHVFGEGLWKLTDRVQAGFLLEQASDDGYLRRYEVSGRDRLTSELFLRASDDRGWGELSAVRFQSLRDGESFGDIPLALPSFEGRRVWSGLPLGGALGLDLAGYALKRTDGPDTAHGSAGLDWERSWLHGASGVELTAHAALRADVWQTSDTPGPAPDRRERLAPLAALEARLPLLRRDARGDALSALTGPGGVTHVIEPILQGVAAPYTDDAPPRPDEDSRIVEFDETNLFSLRRHSGYDGFEEGPRLNVGLRYARLADSGARISAALGRVLRLKPIDSFGAGSGLDGEESDFVGAWSVDLPGRLRLTQRLRVDDDYEVNRNEVYARAAWRGLDISGGYVYLSGDSAAPADRHEVSAEGRYALTPNWFVGSRLQRDLETSNWVETRGSLGYANECVDLSAYVGRRFTETEDVPAATYYGVRVNLWALGGAPGPAAPSGACAPQTE
jgi:LPS-assembly protein